MDTSKALRLMTVQTHLEPIEVQTPHQVQMLRLIRNAGRMGFSHDHAEISEQAQRAWWTVMRGRLHAWLYACEHDGYPVVGFGLIRQLPDGRWSPSAGVMPDFQGRGYGGKIVDNLVDQARSRGLILHAEALLSNPAAVGTHHAGRWLSLGQDDVYAYFRSLP